jgi:hypothetical protein
MKSGSGPLSSESDESKTDSGRNKTLDNRKQPGQLDELDESAVNIPNFVCKRDISMESLEVEKRKRLLSK